MTEAFDTVGDRFVDYYSKVRGYVREELVRKQLQPYLPKTKLNILDVGGGDGRDAVWLARLGHKVTLVDPSRNMTDKANERIIEYNVGNQVSIYCEDPADCEAVRMNTFDLVLSHGVLMYLKNPNVHVKLLANSVKKGGIVSILTKGYFGSMQRIMAKKDTQAAQLLLQTHRHINNLGEDVLAVEPDDIKNLISETDLQLIDWHGVRIGSDYDDRPVRSLSAGEIETILEIEETLGKDPLVKAMGQMLHFIYKRRGTNK